LAKAAGAAVAAAITEEAEFDARKLRADFPIFQQRFHGKPLAYLDSAVPAQKPRQVLDAHREPRVLRDVVHQRPPRRLPDRLHVAIRAGHHCCQPLMTPARGRRHEPRKLRPLHVPEEIDRLVEGLPKVNTTPGMGRARDDPSDGGTRG
jgi:selenocysteine lyase/cysteine desulfurase